MNETEIIENQKNWISRLVRINRGKALLGQYTEGRINDFKKPWRVLDDDDVILTRQILNSELVFDFDCDTWKKVRSSAVKLKEYLDDYEIPYIMAYTGGKGIHIHIFMDPESFAVDEEIVAEAATYGVDISRVVRKTIFENIVKDNRLKVASVEDRNGLDTTKVFFSKHGKGSLIRDFGCLRPNGKVKSVITEIPKDPPEIYSSNMVFPGEIQLANMRRFSKKIEEKLLDAIRDQINLQRQPKLDIVCKGMDLPCYKHMVENGVDSGARNIAVFSIGRLGSLVNCPEEEVVKDMKTFCANSNYKYNEAVQSVKSAYRYKDKQKLCGTICMNFGSEICDRKNCPINKVEEEEK